MKMETGYELDSVSESPAIPTATDTQVNAMDGSDNHSFFSTINPLEVLVPFPHSDFAPSASASASAFSDLDLLHLQPCLVDSFLLDSPLSLLNRHLIESTQLVELFQCGGFPDSETSSFLHMPNLHAVEQTTSLGCLPPEFSGQTEKRRRLAVDIPPQTIDSFVKSGFTISPSSTSGSPASASTPQTKTARDRRRKIAEKTRSLEKLMPWEKKMDMATLLEEAHKYIKFLQAQIAVLRWMPLESVFSSRSGGGDTDLLRVLNRQQILQVMANSSGVQTTLYTRGCCVFSREQLLSLKMMTQLARNL